MYIYIFLQINLVPLQNTTGVKLYVRQGDAPTPHKYSAVLPTSSEWNGTLLYTYCYSFDVCFKESIVSIQTRREAKIKEGGRREPREPVCVYGMIAEVCVSGMSPN